MENILKICYEKSTNLLLIKSLKPLIAESTGESIIDFGFANMEQGNGFDFTYDDEAGGNIEITYGDRDETTGYIEIKADYAYEAIDLYELIEKYVSAREV